MCKVSLAILCLLLLSLIFTPLTQSTAFRRHDRASTHAHRLTHEPGIEFWAQLITYAGCPLVVLLDSFEFFANRPTFARRLYARLNVVGVRVSVRRRLRAGERLPLATHRLAIIVPVVMKPSMVVTDELENFFDQIAQQYNFVEFYRWMFVFPSAHEKNVLYALQHLPLQADSNVWCVMVGTDQTLPFDHPIHLERKMMPIDRFVRRMQMITVHPEIRARTVATLMLPGRHTRGDMAVWQLYRLETRTNTIDVVVELLEINDMGRKVLHQALTPEQRNDFFDQAELTIMVYNGTVKHINSAYVAESMPLFRNARINIQTYELKNRRKRVDFHFQLTITNNFNKYLQGWFAYSLPIVHEHLSLYIHQANIGYHERSSKILFMILLPISILGTLLCLFLKLALTVTNARRIRSRRARPNVSFADMFVWFVGVFAQQGSTIRPNSSSSMIIMLVALYFSSIMYCTYLTKVTSQLSVDVDVDSDLDALLLTKQYDIGMVGNVTTGETFIEKQYNPYMKEAMQLMQQDNSLYSLSYEEGLQRVLTSKYVLIGNAGTVRLAMKNLDEMQRCNITENDMHGMEELVALRMPSTYAYRKMINYEILRYYSNGINNRMREAIKPDLIICFKWKRFYRISMNSMIFQNYLLGTGFALAIALLGIEVLWYHIKKRMR